MEAFLQGFQIVLQPMNIFWVVIGGFLGTIVGMLPGLGPATAVAVLIPITFGMDPTSAIILMAAIYYGAMYGGSRSSILLNTPGDGSAIAATFDGYPMAQKGQAGEAMAISAVASFIGGVLAVFGFIFLAKPLANFALKFGPSEYFLLMLLTLSAIVSLSIGKMVKGFIAMALGLLISTIGIDPQTGVHRFTMDIPHLSEGIEFLIVIIGVYAVGEVFYNFLTIDKVKKEKKKVGRIWFTKEQWKRSKWPILRSAPLGFIVGVLPGAGGSIASMMSYSSEKQLSKKPEEFGEGAVEGLAAPESSNNAASVGAMIPLLTMGIPGSGTTAVMLGALIMLGVRPGPLLFENDPGMVWALINSMFIGNIALVIINILLVGLLVKILDTPAKVLYPLIIMLAFIGTYTLSYSTVDYFLLLLFGVIGLFMKIMDFPIAPLVLAIIVGGDMEQNFRMALTSSNGSLSIFFSSGISITLIVLTVLSLFYPIVINKFKKKSRNDDKEVISA
ncbi:tripartite tricarboxylate transporter permease [Cytobacillus firmus]|uniref:tripartite tricarboxylate transporter permease n=1 Tax=Cytobacillus firmus TaxID=1399 RepID=UPI001C94F626|nr:tripartite tricarboxylate transporter permease [Cytobacillus firmus]MBY6052506.1 tripartite tricarboxylate transporter permease [Cytobacillus firmus]MCS0654968.1 tripartite tricarboxylate transporter permease [Cytobacillus firmus]MCU1807254.1 tripartite tricarboxylate transporter permease [Cytobacillus firmus]USK38819.1 tripartite tricarboxylate transporter permease [Cytobacillus firmus]WHY34025.1 tripartite tricarboxylate transporter permease [Cytobacillus firmus]